MPDKLHAGKRFAVNPVADNMVVVPMRVDDIFNGLVGDFPQRGENFARVCAADVRVNHRYVLFADDKNRVRIKPRRSRFFANDGIHAVGEFLNIKIRLDFFCLRGCVKAQEKARHYYR
jgi:hypothetical protein